MDPQLIEQRVNKQKELDQHLMFVQPPTCDQQPNMKVAKKAKQSKKQAQMNESMHRAQMMHSFEQPQQQLEQPEQIVDLMTLPQFDLFSPGQFASLDKSGGKQSVVFECNSGKNSAAFKSHFNGSGLKLNFDEVQANSDDQLPSSQRSNMEM